MSKNKRNQQLYSFFIFTIKRILDILLLEPLFMVYNISFKYKILMVELVFRNNILFCSRLFVKRHVFAVYISPMICLFSV